MIVSGNSLHLIYSNRQCKVDSANDVGLALENISRHFLYKPSSVFMIYYPQVKYCGVLEGYIQNIGMRFLTLNDRLVYSMEPFVRFYAHHKTSMYVYINGNLAIIGHKVIKCL